jgi:biotin carboxylase
VLLLLPTATYRAAAFLGAAEKLGVEVVVGSERRQALESVMGDQFLLVPLNRPSEAADNIVRYAGDHPLDGIIAVDDQGSLAAAIASARLGLRHSSPAAIAATRDKSAMRDLLRRAGVVQPAFRLAGGAFGEAAEAATRLGFPVVIKPRTLSASRGVIRADDAAAAGEAHARIGSILAAAGEIDTSSVIVEEFVAGTEVAVEGLVADGELHVLAVFDKPDPLEGPYFEETIYVTPSGLSPASLDAVAKTTSQAAAALGLTEGPVHAELRVNGPEEVRVIEIAARTIGGRCSKALTFATGATLEELVLTNALRLGTPIPEFAPTASGVMMIPIPASGILEAVDGIADAEAVPGVRGVDVTASLGRVIEQLPEGDRYLGFIFASGAGPQDVEESLREAHRRLRIRIAAPT